MPIVWRLASEDLARCDFGETAYLPDALFLIPGTLGLLAGRYLSWLRPPERYPDQATSGKNRGAQLIGPWAVVFASAALAVIWFYEAIGTAHYTVVSNITEKTATFEPITHYIRCAIYHDKAASGFGLWTIATILLLGFVVGHWLWSDHPGYGKKDGSQKGA